MIDLVVSTQIKRGTAQRLGLEPPWGPILGVLTADNVVLLPEEYRQLKDRWARAVVGNWSFIYSAYDSEVRGRQHRGRSRWMVGGQP